MIHTRIISIQKSFHSNFYEERISHKHSKYIRRKKYVNEVLYPELVKLNYFDSVDIFSAITPEDFQFINGNIIYKDIKIRNDGHFPANLMSNYLLWKLCIELNDLLLILEDDVFLPKNNIDNIIKSINYYNEFKDSNCLLYLLSQCPQNIKMKTYDKSKINVFDENFLEWKPLNYNLSLDDMFEDISGTAAYVINPNVAKILCNYAENNITQATDRFIGKICKDNEIKIIIPKQIEKSFLLYEQLETWNLVHKISEPPIWNDIPEQLKIQYLMGGNAKLEHKFVDEINNKKTYYTNDEIDKFIEGAKNRNLEFGCYGKTDEWLYEALDIISIKNKNIAVMGSITPYYESVVLACGGFPTTVEYNLPNYNHPKIKEVLLYNLLRSDEKFDAAISISSFEHDGLGRYGDPLNPIGDLRAMLEMKKILKPGGILFLSVPCGVDKIVWNAHRVYGNYRLKLLLNSWVVLGTVGYESEYLSIDMGSSGIYQPIIVLKNN